MRNGICGQNQDYLHVWNPGTDMSTNITTFHSADGCWRNFHTYKHPRPPVEPTWLQDPCRHASRNIPWILNKADHQLPWNKSAHKLRIGLWLLTCHGIEKFAQDDQAWNPNQDVEDWEDDGQRFVPIAHGPGPYREDHCWIPINTARNRNWSQTYSRTRLVRRSLTLDTEVT